MGRIHDLAHTITTAAPAPARTAPKGWEPGIAYEHGRPAQVTTPAVPEVHDGNYDQMMAEFGWPLPAGARLELVEARYDPAAWTRDQPFTGEDDAPYRKTPATTRPAWRYKFRVVTDPAEITKQDIDALVGMLEKRGTTKPPAPAKTDSAYVVTLADLQLGKGHDGPDGTTGIDATIDRALGTLEAIARDIRKVKPAEIALLDAGDLIENCHNTSSQPRTNDLDLTEQVRVATRILLRFIKRLSPLAPKMTVAAIPSNHGQVRLGPKAPASGPWDDYGLLAMSTVQDAIDLGLPGANITWAYPRRGHTTLTIPIAGTNLGLAHGHDAPSTDKVPDWIGKQAAGRQPLTDADVIVTGHWHHLRVQQILGGRWWLQAPAADAGSQWWTRTSGEWSAPGILTFQTQNTRIWDIKVN